MLEGIASSDRELIKKFYSENFKYISKYILQNSGNLEDVEDVFQDALVLVYEKLQSDSLDLRASLRTYFFAICKNLWQKRLRGKKKMIVVEEVHAPEMIEDNFLSFMESKEREHLYRKYFLKLSDACKELLEMVFLQKSMKEIANITGYSEGYTRKKKFNCKKSLIERIEQDPLYQELKIDLRM